MSLDTMEALARFIAGLFALVGLPVLTYVARTSQSINAEIRRIDERQRQHHQTLYGEQEDNGLKGGVEDSRRIQQGQATVLQTHGFRLDEHGRRLDKLDRQ